MSARVLPFPSPIVDHWPADGERGVYQARWRSSGDVVMYAVSENGDKVAEVVFPVGLERGKAEHATALLQQLLDVVDSRDIHLARLPE